MNSTFKLIASLVCHKAALWLAVKFIASQVCHRVALVVGCGIERGETCWDICGMVIE